MARFNTIVVVASVLLVLAFVPISDCAKKPDTGARKEDIPYIKCQVCEKVAAQLYNQVHNKRAQIAPKKISEYEIIEITENVCNLKKSEADWILQIDIVEQGDRLELVEQDTEGQCNSECKTIERACQEVIGYSDTDVAEYLYTQPQIESLTNYLCKDLTKACRTKPPPVPKGRTPGEPFLAKPAKDAEMDKIMKSMEGMPGAPNMKMYSREDLMNMKNFGNEDADDDDDDDDDDNDDEGTSFPSKLGKVLRGKESSKGDWKQKITMGIEKTGKTLKKHAHKVSNQVRQWWRRANKPSPKKSSKGKKQEL